jgi:hypothetical protein
MKSFTEHTKLLEEQAQYLEEKLIMLSNGKRYGQIVFLAGGAGSGKGFAATNFMQSELFKIRDVDEWKSSFMKIADLADNPEKLAKLHLRGSTFDPEKFREIKGLNLKKPADVSKLHQFVDELGIKDNTMTNMLKGMRNRKTLPNIMFDITAKNVQSIHNMMPDLLRAGYNPANIHMVWVLTNYQIAIKNNSSRSRVVPADIMLQTHSGAANTMFSIIQKKGKKLAINGSIHVILNNPENTIKWEEGDVSRGGKKLTKAAISNRTKGRWQPKSNKLSVIKDFTYITLKHRGKDMKTEKEILVTLHRWIENNVPEEELNKDFWSEDPIVLDRP